MNFVYRHVISGGAESLLLRLGKRLVEEGENCNLVCQTISNKMEEAFEGANVNIIQLNWWSSRAIHNAIKQEKTLFYGAIEFLSVMDISESKDDEFFLYIVHPDTIKVSSRRFPLLNSYFAKKMPAYVEQFDVDGRICFMDYMCIEECEKYYNIKLKNARKRILRIPIDIKSDLNISTSTEREKAFSILTVSRAEYPFKGYVKGLIEDLGSLNRKINLQIISYGDGITELEKWISDAKKYKSMTIELIGETSYEKLSDYYSACDVYVGMGTTILEASLRGKLSIPVRAYTYDFKASHFFFEEPEWVGTRFDEKKNGIELIKKVFSMTENEKERYERMGQNAVSELYSMETFFKTVRNIHMDKCDLQLTTLMKLLFKWRLYNG